MTKYITYILSLILAIGLTSCQDDYFNRLFEHDGGDVLLSIDFMPASSAEVKTRSSNGAPGEGMQDINDLCLVFFNEAGEFADIMDISDKKKFPYTDSRPDRTEADTSNGKVTSEDKTARRDYHLDLPSGKYYIYVVANMGTGTHRTLMDLNVDKMSREEFRQIRRTWDTEDYSNNSEMSGICTSGKPQQGTSVYTGMEENPVIVKPGIYLHCWLRRLASKVTVDFDATHLDPSTTIYLKEIRVKDVAYDCSLVAKNTATENKDVEHGIIAESGDFIRLCGDSYADDPNSNFVNWPYLTAGIPTLKDLVSSFDDTSTPSAIAAQKERLESIGHLNSSPCIYFYENMQGVHEDKPKMQDGDVSKDSDGNYIYTPDGFIDSPDSYLPSDPDYKDQIRAGTYVEVEAYYQSVAAGNEGQGRIIYRFMLGKDELCDYDVERNYHYKLTLCFMGYANDVDWHIEYDVDRPPYSIPDEYFISYGYNESLEFPISITGELVDDRITAEIVRNDWGPSKMWVDAQPDGGDSGVGKFFVWSPSGVVYPANDENRVSLGFLSLRKPQNDVIGNNYLDPKDNNTRPYNATESQAYIWKAWYGEQLDTGDKSRLDYTDKDEIFNTNYDFTDNPDKEKYYERLYKGKRSLGYRVYQFENMDSKETGDYTNKTDENDDSEDGSFRVYTKKPSSSKYPRESTYYIPLYTRERNICKSTGYTGENPYNNYQRRAKVIFRFSVKDRNGKITKCVKEVPIIQTTKIGNPMGIWRAWNNAAPFDVQMKYVTEDGLRYEDLTSHEGGWSAEVEQGADWILLNGGRKKVTGEKGSKIHFTYRPIGVLSNPSQVRCGIITVRYHNFACIHKIFVRQGYAPLKIYPKGGVYFHTGNLVTADTEAENPCDEGSMFKAGNLEQPIDAIENVNDSNPWGQVTPNMFKDHSATKFKIAGKKTEDGQDVYKTWDEIDNKGGVSDLKWPNEIVINGTVCEIMGIDHVSNLRDGMDDNTDRIRYQYGVLYSDKATSTANTTDAAYHYKQADSNTHSYGMRGCFIYNNTDGRQLFFPIGSSGYGKRKSTRNTVPVGDNCGWNPYYTEVGTAVLRYSSSRISYMNSWQYLPLLWDIFRANGANYWCKEVKTDPVMGAARTSLDLNYNTFDFTSLGEEVFGGATSENPHGSDAFFIRLIQRTPPSASN